LVYFEVKLYKPFETIDQLFEREFVIMFYLRKNFHFGFLVFVVDCFNFNQLSINQLYNSERNSVICYYYYIPRMIAFVSRCDRMES